MEQSNNFQERETVAGVTDRLMVWIKNTERGLARVCFDSGDAREKVVAGLRSRCEEAGISFTEISVKPELNPQAVVESLIENLKRAKTGVVSVSGFEVALSHPNWREGEGYYAINFARERLSHLPLRQIWWMPVHIADEFLRTIPDLNSWFLHRLFLKEIMPFLENPVGKTDFISDRPSLSTEEAREMARELESRFNRAFEEGESTTVLLSDLVVPALDALRRAGAEREARELATKFDLRLAQQGESFNTYYEAWEIAAEQEVREAEQRFGPYARELSPLLMELASFYKENADYAEAEKLVRRALEIDEKSYGPDHPEVATDLNNLAQLLQDTNRLSEAEPLMRRALEIDERSYGPEHPNVARNLNNLAQLLQDTNRLSEAEPLMRRALEIDERSYGPEHPNVAIRMNNLASLLQDTNRLSEAEPLMQRVVTIFEKAYGEMHPNVATALNNLAQLLKATNRLSEAEPLMRRALEIDERSYGPEHPNVARDLNNLASLLQATNRLSEAEPLMRRALEIDEKSYGPEHPNVARDLNNLASLLQATNRLSEAEPLARRAAEIHEASYGPDHPHTKIVQANLAQIIDAQK